MNKETGMSKINITKTELVWPGKYNEDGTLKEVLRVNSPFQVIETINESRATREAKKGGAKKSTLCRYVIGRRITGPGKSSSSTGSIPRTHLCFQL
jgi:hypothetical protein